MLWRHEISVPSGFEAVINGRVSKEKCFVVRSDDQVYFINFAPAFLSVACEAVCLEGLAHRINITLRLELQRENLLMVLGDAGDSRYRKILRITAEDLATRQKLTASVEAVVKTYTRATHFFTLTEQDQVRDQLDQLVGVECQTARLIGKVLDCEVERVMPTEPHLAELRAQAGVREEIQDGKPVRVYADQNLGRIVDYFWNVQMQAELLQVETARIKTDTERARKEAEAVGVAAQTLVVTARTNLKIHEAEEENRRKAREAELEALQAEWQAAAQERNARIMEQAAVLEHTYKQKRQREEAELEANKLASRLAAAAKEFDLVQARAAERSAARAERREDIKVEVERERELAEIRGQERERTLAQLADPLSHLVAIPEGVHTLVTNGSAASGVIATILSRWLEELTNVPLASLPAGDGADMRVAAETREP